MYLVLGLLIFLSNPLYASQDGNLADAYLSDAKISASTGDLYRSYKLYTYLYKNHNTIFNKKAIEDYLNVTSRISSEGRFQKTCEVLSQNKENKNRVHYHCAKILYQKGNYKLAEEHINQVEAKNKLSVLKPTIAASIAIAKEEYKKCLKLVSTSNLSLFKKHNIEDLFYLTRARCLNGDAQYTQALTSYQSINSSSPYYFEALMELSWTLFKTRNAEGVKSTTEAIFATYNPSNEDLNKEGASAYQYYQSKYILGFLDLVLFTGKQEAKFLKINSELEEYKKEYFLDKKELKAFYKEVTSNPSISDLKLKSKTYNRFFYQVGQWLSFEKMNDLENIIYNIIALNKEKKRTESYDKKYSKYINALNTLYNHYDNKLKEELSYIYDKSYRTINGFVLKNKIGSVDFKSLKETSGLRSLEEATAEYKDKESNLMDKLGGLSD